MKTNSQRSPASRTRPIWELFFQLTFISESPTSWSLLGFVLSKLMTFSHPLMLLLYGTSYSYWSDLAAYFVPMTYFNTA